MAQLIVDIGNTRIKTVVFEKEKNTEVVMFETSQQFIEFVKTRKLQNLSTIISSVRSESSTNSLVKVFKNAILLNFKTKIPIINSYASPQTLGNDRLANVIFANNEFPNENNLVIDIGTCMKFDFINKEKEYIGGSISLGFSMRYKALHNLTDNLPLLDNETTNQLIGIDTKSSMVSGVYNGMLAELKHFIYEYEKNYSKVNVFLTGGDLSYFENKELSQKNSIFVDPLLTLKGLKVILDYNE
jgi:type III pantothenate kinase